MIILGGKSNGGPSSTATRGSRYQRSGGEEDAAPARGRGRASAAPAESSRGRGRTRDDEDSGGSRGRSRDEAGPKREAARGWSGAKRIREETSDYADRFKLDEKEWQLIAFMEDDPFDSAGRHFLNGIQGQRSFICPGKKGPYKCALCGVGDKAMPITYFNILYFEGDELKPVLKVWEAGPGYTTSIETQIDSRAVDGHLSSVYFEVKGKKSASGKGATTLEINPIRERDLLDEWNIEPLTEEEFAVFLPDMKVGEEYVKFAPQRALEEAAAKLEKLAD